MSDLPRPARGMNRGGAVWYPRSPIGDVRRRGPRGPVMLMGHDDRGDPVRVTMSLRQAAALGPAITAAAQPKENPNA